MSNLTKYSGVDFYEDYILPTNNASKNPLWRNLWKSSWKFIQNGTVESLQERVDFAYRMGGMHTVFAILSLSLSGDVSANLMINLLINIYPVFVQLKTRNRIMRILEHRSWRRNKPSEEEQLEEILRTDVQILERIVSLKNMKEW